jgi:flagellar hook-associated protein 3 FlgL
MRVPTNAFPSALVQQLHQLNSRQNRLQTQAATGQKLQWAADDPASMERALDLQNVSRSNTQYGKNIDFLKERTTASLSAIRTVNTVLDRANEIAILADGAKSPEQLKNYATEVDQLIRQAVSTGNSKHRGEFLFGGTRTDQPPFSLTEDADGNVTGVTYQGNSDVAELEVARDSTVPLQVAGANSSGSGAPGLFADSRAQSDIFGHLLSLRQHLAAGDTDAIASTDRPALLNDEDQVLYRLAETGASQARLEAADSTNTNQASQIRQSLSATTDADLASTLVELSATQTAYRAALQSGANLLGVSLMDYMR